MMISDTLPMHSPIFIYGPPASGKSAIGQRLAENLGVPFYDLDGLIQARAGKSIPEIFAEDGEAHFRDQESEALREVVSRPKGVVALGGGALLRPQNRRMAQAAGPVICLSASFETILARLNQEAQMSQVSTGQVSTGRPLLDGDAQEQLRLLLDRRNEHYASFPLQLASDLLSIEASAWQAQIQLGYFRVQVNGGGVNQTSGYDVQVVPGGLKRLGEMLQLRQVGGPLALVSDQNVADYHLESAVESLESAGYPVTPVLIPPGEATKTLRTVESMLDRFLQAGLERSCTVVALGGGVVGDLAGFAAAIYLRGVRWVGVPTSLLAMVDASLGGKTGADLPQGKNLVGAFHSPVFVLADSKLLTTLPAVELRNGMAEVVKHGVLADPQLFERCCQGWDAVRSDLAWIVPRAMAVKVSVIQQDPYERGVRATLNLGHTLGHGLEVATDFRLRHGEAVAIGMVAAARLAERMGICQRGLALQIEGCLQGLGLPTRLPVGIEPESVLAGMRVDKKRQSGRLRLVLPEQIGKARWGVEIDHPADLIEVME